MSKELDGKKRAAHWFTQAERLSGLEQPFRAKNIAICLASAYRKGKRYDEATPTTADIIEACGGDWVLEAWDEQNPDDFPLAVMRLMRDERRKQRELIAELREELRSWEKACEQ